MAREQEANKSLEEDNKRLQLKIMISHKDLIMALISLPLIVVTKEAEKSKLNQASQSLNLNNKRKTTLTGVVKNSNRVQLMNLTSTSVDPQQLLKRSLLKIKLLISMIY